MATSHSFIKNQQSLQCESTGNRSYLDLLLFSLTQFSLPVKMILSYLRTTLYVLVHKVQLAGRAVLQLHLSREVNARIYVGGVVMGVVAPLTGCAYMLFSRTDHVQGWYHVNYFHFFYLLGPHLFEFFCLCGVFLLFPRSSKRAYFIAIPTGYVLAKIIWLIQIKSNQELWQVVPSSFILISILISLVILLTLDFLTWRKFHRVDAFEKRIDGILQVSDDLPSDKVVSMLKLTWRERKDFQTKY
jgi:hypothetical protein